MARSGASAGLFFSSGVSRTTSPYRFTASIAICSRSSARPFCSFAAFSALHRPHPLAIRPHRQPGADRRRGDEQERERPGRRQRRAVLAGELLQLVRRRRRAGFDRVAFEVALDVLGEAVGRLVPPRPVLLQRLHHDPVEVAADELRQPGRLDLALGRDRRQVLSRLRKPRARLRRLLLADPPQDLGEGRLAQRLALQRRRAGQQLVEQHAQRVDVGPRVDVEPGHLGLLGAHVFERADDRAELGEHRPLGQPLVDRLGHAEVDHLRHRLAVVERHRTFDGLMSRWMMPFWWACWIAWQTGMNSSSRSRGERLSRSQYSVIGTPLTSSITK